MEPYQYWTIAGFLFLFLELMTLRTFALIVSGAALFAAVTAFKFPDLIYAQILTFVVFIPLLYMAIKPCVKSKFGQGKNEHK